MGKAVEITDSNFKDIVSKNSVVLVDFWMDCMGTRLQRHRIVGQSDSCDIIAGHTCCTPVVLPADSKVQSSIAPIDPLVAIFPEGGA